MSDQSNQLDAYEQKLLNGWEEVYKQGQLTLWIMLSLKDGPKHMAKIKSFIHSATDHSLSADDQSLYRALRRYHDAEMVTFQNQPSPGGGPDRKVYQLTEIGRRVLNKFSGRNISRVFYKPEVKSLIENVKGELK